MFSAAFVFASSEGVCMTTYKIYFQNQLITVYNWMFQHELTIENDEVNIILKSEDK